MICAASHGRFRWFPEAQVATRVGRRFALLLDVAAANAKIKSRGLLIGKYAKLSIIPLGLWHSVPRARWQHVKLGSDWESTICGPEK